jgi:hypothetical protein
MAFNRFLIGARLNACPFFYRSFCRFPATFKKFLAAIKIFTLPSVLLSSFVPFTSQHGIIYPD